MIGPMMKPATAVESRAHFPAHEPTAEPVEELAVEEPAADEPNEEETPSIGQRVRDYLIPRWWR